MADSDAEIAAELSVLAAEVAAAREADVYFYSGYIGRPRSDEFRRLVRKHHRRPKALLLLTTVGGSGDAAYQMARCLQKAYRDGSVSVLVSTYCKSAGTLLTLGAKEILMTDAAELGPLDVQIIKPDTLGERMSGLTPSQSLTTLRGEALDCFETFFFQAIELSGH